MNRKQNSLTFLITMLFGTTVIITTLVLAKIVYDKEKAYMLNSIEKNTLASLNQLGKIITPFVETYSISEYEKIIQSEMNREYVYAIIVDNIAMAKLLDTQDFITGKIRGSNWDIIDIDKKDKNKLDTAFFFETIDLKSSEEKIIGTISIYSTDKFVYDELESVVIEIAITALLISSILVFILFMFFKKMIISPINTMVETIGQDTIEGIPSKELQGNDIKELNILATTINNMLQEIKKSKKNIKNYISFLKSHQLAMDESSIVTKSDLYGNIIYANDNFYKITGLSEEETLGKPHSIVRHPDNPKHIFKELWETIKNKKVWKGQIKNKSKNGEYWVETAILPILDEEGEIVEYIAVRHDVTQIIKQQQKLDTIANTDTLTGYGNRYKLQNDIQNSSKPALAILNIDNFTQLNDFYGHEKGDEIIQKLGDLLSYNLDATSFHLYHLQGDEYVILSENISEENFIKIINKLILMVRDQTLTIENEELFINITASISFEEKTKLLITADMALKTAKKNNKHFVIYTDELSLNEIYKNNIKWSNKIKKALENDQIIPVFQPIVNNHNGSWEKYECLVRLQDEEKLVSPYFFLEISKKTKYYTAITKTMIQKSIEQFKQSDKEFSINLTIEDILNDEIINYIFELLQKYPIGDRIVFEIVESEAINDFDKVVSFITKIKKLNCKIAIDDFGTGYSNFEYLVKIQADYIKIDGSLIKDIDTNKTSYLVVKNIVHFAHDLNMKTIAEFVENESVLNTIKELGIDYSQGYYFSAPKKELEL